MFSEKFQCIVLFKSLEKSIGNLQFEATKITSISEIT